MIIIIIYKVSIAAAQRTVLNLFAICNAKKQPNTLRGSDWDEWSFSPQPQKDKWWNKKVRKTSRLKPDELKLSSDQKVQWGAAATAAKVWMMDGMKVEDRGLKLQTLSQSEPWEALTPSGVLRELLLLIAAAGSDQGAVSAAAAQLPSAPDTLNYSA